MSDATGRAYRHAEGCCLDAMQALRRFSSKEALECLAASVRAIEDEHARARRAQRSAYGRVPMPATQPSDGPIEF